MMWEITKTYSLCYMLKQNTRLNKVFTFQSRNLQKKIGGVETGVLKHR